METLMFSFRPMHSYKSFVFELTLALLIACPALLSAIEMEQTPSATQKKITIAYAAHPQSGLPQIAQAKGYFADAGLETTTHKFPSGKAALADLLAGKADFATVAETPLMFAVMNNAKLSVIATIQTSSLSHAIIAQKDKGILSLNDLKGKKIGAALSSSSHFFLDTILTANGISRKEVELVDIKAEKIPDALANGEIDAGSTFTPYVELTQRKLGNQGITFREQTLYRYNFVIVAMNEFIHQNPDSVKKLLQALIKAEQFTEVNPGDSQQIVADFCGIETGIVRNTWADATLDVTLDQSLIIALEDETRWAIRIGLQPAVKMPNYLDYIYLEGLKSVKPGAVRISR